MAGDGHGGIHEPRGVVLYRGRTGRGGLQGRIYVVGGDGERTASSCLLTFSKSLTVQCSIVT